MKYKNITNEAMDKEFAKAFYKAIDAGVEVIFYLCEVREDELKIVGERRYE